MILETLRLAATNLLMSPRRTILTTGALTNAVVGGLLFYGFTRHTYWGLSESFARGGNGHVQIADADWFDAATPEEHRVERARLEAVRATLLADPELGPHIAASTLRRQVMGMLTAGGRTSVFIGVGTEASAEAVLAPLATPGKAPGSAGRPLAEDAAEVILGTTLAARLGVAPGTYATALTTTDRGMTNAMDLEIVGTAKSGIDDLDRTIATMPLTTALALTDSDRVDVLVLALDDTAYTEEALGRVEALLASQGSPPSAGGSSAVTGSTTLAARPWYTRATYYVAVRALYDRIFGVFEALMALVTILSLSHAVAAVVAERRHEIAMLRVIGLRRADVAGLFVAEGALLGVLGCISGAVVSVVIAWITERLGGLPMPPPPGFTVGYAAMFHLDALGFAIVLPATLVAAVLASAFPAWRATRGELSRGLAGLAVLLVVGAYTADAHADDPVVMLARAEAIGALPADKRCRVDLTVTDAAGDTRWRVAAAGADSLVVSTSLAEGRRQAVLVRGDETWFQTEAMRAPMRVTPAQRLTGQLAAGDLLAPRLTAIWTPTVASGNTLQVTGKPGAPWPRAELDLDATGHLSVGRFYAPSGKVVRTATWRWSGDRLAGLDVVDAAGARSKVTLSAPSCGPVTTPITPDTMLAAAKGLAGE